ncbi:pimeloyl-ACP methyl ester carboxylesterase [Aquimarina sp. EL_43]|uniref:alpha/beta hydrolase n=1 Tax=Aquimarina TaxID=290174 RepID=UPI0004710A29|nr:MULTISPECIES: alpha/beta hydrolase [Aquimarina]MBG6128724.1 pimeloyl-ACP methyl ester carboxylesterase [Aquimarina sp. EL_35]MBG6149787.1 pimeloyl-ACP methyl ester carboxylesterase [Aquimarina sp. EL_32]MBG6167527.1 pimeloyl-ACP methyl ester carboxylesterase [Aquimarina sp. EL_43]
MKSKFYLFMILISALTFAQKKEFNSAVVKINKYIEGSLVTPYSEDNVPLVIFIMDAGAINRDGNDRMSKNDTFKKLSYELAKEGIATYRYDKRLFKMDGLGIKEHEISLDHYIEDAISIIDYFNKNGKYKKVIIAGHGQGSLVGMIAAKGRADGFISIAGNAVSIDQVIIEQIAKQAPGLDKSASVAFKQLKENGRATSYDPALESIFRYNLQPFMSSWIKYNPSEEILKLEMPILIIYGDKDIQVESIQAEKFKEIIPQAEYLFVTDMNHILKEIKGGRLENHKSYNEPFRKIMPEVLTGITNFVNQ